MRNYLRPASCAVACVLMVSCGGSGGGSDALPAANAPCVATMALDGSITLPLVAADDGNFSYVMTPLTTDPTPNEYSATRQAVNTNDFACTPVAFSAKAGDSLKASNMARMGQVTNVAFAALPQSATLFTKSSASAMGMLDGYAGGGVPLANGSVTLKDSSGASLATGQTNAYGAIILYSPTLPDSFKVTVSGGTQSGAPFVGTLKAEIEDYTTAEEEVSVNVTPVTTLVSTYHERHPGVALNDVMTAVKDKLGMPTWLRITADHQGSDDYFDLPTFYAAANAAGSVDTLVNAVLDDWEQGIPHNFPPPDAAAPANATAMKPQVDPLSVASGLFSIAGTIYGFYTGSQTSAWQAEVIAKLNQISRQIDEMQSSINQLTAITLEVSYTTRRLEISRWENLLIVAYGKIVWLSTHPAPAQPAGCPAVAPARVGDDVDGKPWSFYGSIPGCWTFLSNQIDTRAAKNVLATVTNPPPDMGDPATLFPQKIGSSGGLIAIYRQQVNLKPDNKQAHKFFTYEDSVRLWQHYQYWQNIQALLAFFYSDWRKFSGDDAGAAAYQSAYATNTTAQLQSMPQRKMLKGMYLDQDNTDFYGTKVGGPMLWWPTLGAPPLCNLPEQAAFSNTNELGTEFYLNIVFACYRGAYPTPTLWRLPTVREWEAFSQVKARPDRNVGQWLVDRGMKSEDGLWFNDKYFFATIATTCSSSNPGWLGVSCFFHTFSFPIQSVANGVDPVTGNPRQQVFWLPFIRFNVNHSPVLEANSGYVVPVRDTTVGEYN